MSRRGVLVVGAVAAALGLVAVLVPGVLAVGLDRVALGALGAVALLQAVRVLRARGLGRLRGARTDDPEHPRAVPTSGDDREATLEAFAGDTRFRESTTRRGLVEAAVAVLTRYGDVPTDEARTAVAEGTWTDDPVAAAFLADGTGPSLPFRDRIAGRVSLESDRERGIGRTIDAIAAHADLTTGDDRGGVTGRLRARLGGRSGPVAGSVRSARARLGLDGSRPGGRGPDARTAAGDRRPTAHWDGVGGVALVAVGVGVLLEAPAVVLLGTVGIGYAAYAGGTTLPTPDLAVERTVEDDRPAPGDAVEVTVAVTNEGERAVPDLRLVDGVPDGLAVEAGSPRLGTALAPGETATFGYAVGARRGVHDFEELVALARDRPGAGERVVHLADATTITCRPQLSPFPTAVPLRARHTRYAGRVETDSGGDGVEFHATREYRPGDPPGRIDWNRRARTGALATLEFREERAATVAVVVDSRAAAYLAPTPHEGHAVDHAVDAAGRAYATLLAAGNRAGLGAFDARDCWVAPGSGDDHRLRVRELVATHPALAARPRGRAERVGRWLQLAERRLPADAQVLFLSPLCDPAPARTVRKLEAAGYPVTVVSPDPTADATAGHRIARVARRLRIADLRDDGVPVVDWAWGESAATAIDRFATRGGP